MTTSDLLHVAGREPRRLTFGRVVTVLSAGNHHPLLCELEADATRGAPAGYWVVKPQDVISMGNRRPGAFNVVAELAGAEVCAWAGIRTPATGLLRFPPKPFDQFFVSVPQTWQTEVKTLFEMNSGRLAFCCRFLQGLVDVDPDTLKGVLGRAATHASGGALFAVDAYIRHDDRRSQNPNAGWLDEEIVALDHGSAFAGVDRTGVDGSDVARQTVLHASSSFREHIFYAPLRRYGGALDWNGIAVRLAGVTDEAIDVASAGWPDELEPWKARIVSFLRTRRRYAVEIMTGASEMVKPNDDVGRSNAAG